MTRTRDRVIFILLCILTFLAASLRADAASLSFAQHEIVRHAEAAGISEPIIVVQSVGDICPNANVLRRQSCNAWITWSTIGWIVTFTPKGLKNNRASISRTAAHEICHIIHHSALLRKVGDWDRMTDFERLQEEVVALRCVDLRMQALAINKKEKK